MTAGQDHHHGGEVHPIPFTEAMDDPGEFQIWMDAVVDGESCRLLLDTGARRTAIPATVTDGLAMASGSVRGGGVSGTHLTHPRVLVRSLQAGPFVAERIELDVIPAGSPAPAVLGMDVIGRHRCEFDFAAETLRVDADPRPQMLHPISREQAPQPHVDVTFERSRSVAVWDTGASTSVVDLSWARDHPDAVTVSGPGLGGTDSTGTAVSGSRGRLAECTIGGLHFNATNCAVVDLSAINATLADPIEIILGLPVLRQAVWSFNFPDHEWSAEDQTAQCRADEPTPLQPPPQNHRF